MWHSVYHVPEMAKSRKYNSREDWHAYWVYQDTEFIKIMKKLSRIKDAHEAKTIREVLAKEYAISTERIISWGLSYHMSESVPNNISDSTTEILFDFEEGGEVFNLSLKKSVTKAEYLKMWDYFVVWRNHVIKKPQRARKKPPENTQLLYAIFRARSNGLTFTQIYGLYSDDRLPLYEGVLGIHNTNQKRQRLPFGDSESLARYYRKYRPDT